MPGGMSGAAALSVQLGQDPHQGHVSHEGGERMILIVAMLIILYFLMNTIILLV